MKYHPTIISTIVKLIVRSLLKLYDYAMVQLALSDSSLEQARALQCKYYHMLH